jgi:hypothetical protein
MFVGAINADLRSVLARLAPAWQGLPAFVGCSGNFTVERLLAAGGPIDLHGNDVSLYSCALGAHLAGKDFRVTARDGELAWLGDWLQPGLPTLATLLLCTSALEFHGRDNPYHRRMWDAYLRRWPDMHAKTLANLEKGLAGLSLRDFYAGDVADFFANAPQDSVLISFPPTYKGGYERLYKKLQAAFAWDEPAYPLFTPDRFNTLLEVMTAKRFWCVSRDEPAPPLERHRVGLVKTSARAKPVFVYSNTPSAVLTQARQRLQDVPFPRLSEPPVEDPPTLITLRQEHLNTLRSEYLNAAIAPATVTWAFGLLLGGRLAGAVARIAGIVHVAQAIDKGIPWTQPIPAATVEAAVRLARDYFLLHAQVAFSIMGADESWPRPGRSGRPSASGCPGSPVSSVSAPLLSRGATPTSGTAGASRGAWMNWTPSWTCWRDTTWSGHGKGPEPGVRGEPCRPGRVLRRRGGAH